MVNFAVVGIGNFGLEHVNAARAMADAGLAHFTAVADIRLSAFPELVAELRGRGVACYESHRELIDKHPELDLITLPMPIQLHAPMAIECMERGLNVLVEKPPAATFAEAQQIAEAAKRTGKLCGVGFQMSTSPLIHVVCDLVRQGKLGAITALSTSHMGKRYDNYYARAVWAGKIRVNGVIVRDGTLNNPFAHHAQALFTIAHAAAGTQVRPIEVEAELYAGHDIETEDTTSIRARLSSGVQLNFYSSVCTHLPGIQQIRVEGTKGTVTWNGSLTPQSQVQYADGTTEILPDISNTRDGITLAVFRNFIEVLDGKAPRLACPIEDTLAFAEFVERVFEGENVVHLHGTPYATRVELEENGVIEWATYLQDVEQYMTEAYASGKLYSEVGAPWAKAAVK